MTWGQATGRTETEDSTSNEGFSKLINMTSNMRLSVKASDMFKFLVMQLSKLFQPGDELESIPLTHDSNQLETCVVQLREVLGPLIDEDQLVQVSLAADYDVNRALNYFFNAEQDGLEEEQ